MLRVYRWLSFVMRHTLAVVLSFFIIVAAMLEPLARWIAWAAVSIRGYLPQGDLWSRSQVQTAGNRLFGVDGYGWSGLVNWIDSTPWPTMVIVMIAAIRLVTWAGTKEFSTRTLGGGGPVTGPRFGGWSETLSFVGWSAIGSVAWRFWWGLFWDPPRDVWFPICDGPAHIGLLWLGAILGHAWTMAFLLRRSAAHALDSRRCIKCGYSLQGLALSLICPECGQDQNEPLNASRLSHIPKFLRRYSILGIAIMLLAIPYISALLADLLTH